MIAMLSLSMASITIRRLDDVLKSRLRVRAARQGRSMEEEARHILKAGLAEEPMRQSNLAELIRRRIAPAGGIELSLPLRERVRRPPKLAK
jgi:plasmid stability protein